MTALQLQDLTMMADEPRVRDARLGEVLGFSQPRFVRRVIKANLDELLMHGLACQVSTPIRSGKGRAQVVEEYYLNEAQALLVCMFARTPKAAEIRRQVIEVFMAWRRGLTQKVDETLATLARLEERLTALEATGRPLARLIEAPAEPALALPHTAILWFDQVRAVRPKFWGDVEVRGLLLAAYRQMTIDQARERCRAIVGLARTPSRSAIGRFWTRLDRLLSAADDRPDNGLNDPG